MPTMGGLHPQILPVAGTPYDFTRPREIGNQLEAAGPDGSGYDHNFVLHGLGPDAAGLVQEGLAAEKYVAAAGTGVW